MTNFYHQKFNLLVCSTIIENGIDIPSANTIIVIRADKFGLAQLHQLRGRVGRSHHQAYAYLFIPEYITDDARQRLNAIAAAKTLGAGFSLAMQDLEIRGAGELLGHEQSGDIAKVGFTLYLSMLERAVEAFKTGELTQKPVTDCEIDLQSTAMIPHDYLPDVQTRLLLYKRIANTQSTSELSEIKIELIDRFGKTPQEVDNLLQLTRLRHKAVKLGITKIKAATNQMHVSFNSKPEIDISSLMELIQKEPDIYKLQNGDTLLIRYKTTSFNERVQFILTLGKRLKKKKAIET